MIPKRAVGRVQRKRRERGNALIEFALMSTVLMGMTLGVADFGRIFAMGSRAASAASAATSYGALDAQHYSNFPAMEEVAMRNLTGVPYATAAASRTCRCGIGGSPVDCEADEACGPGVSKQTYIQVLVAIPFRSLSGLPIVPGMTTVRGKSVIRVE